jgi:hypothetical protein
MNRPPAFPTTASPSRLAPSLTTISLLAFGLLPACSEDDPALQSAVQIAAQAVYAPTNQTQDHLSFQCTGGAPVVVKGPGGVPLEAGAIVTGPDVRDILLDNGEVHVTYELTDQYGADPPKHQLGAHMLYRKVEDAPPVYRRALTTLYGDWTFFAAPFKDGAVEAHVLTRIDDVAEIAFVFEHELDFPGENDTYGHTPSWWQGPGACTTANGCKCYLSGCGVTERDQSGVGIRIPPYCDQPSCLRRIRSVKFVKTIRLERCAEGYFVGYHSDPSLSPKDGLAGNNENSYGEREFGTGSGNAVTWSSAGNVFKHPGQTQHSWMGIDDPTYLPDWPGQYPDFPAEQLEGPWWVADLPYFNRADETPFVRYIMMEHRLETGVWAFNQKQLGSTVVHFVNDETEATGLPTRYQLFIGALPYVSDDEIQCAVPGLTGTWRCYPNEPKMALTQAIQARAPLSWPD